MINIIPTSAVSPDAVLILAKAKTRMLLGDANTVFYSSMLYDIPMHFTDSLPTAAVDQAGNMFINPNFIRSLTPEQVVFLLAHELRHLIGDHTARLGERDAREWNIATDKVINDDLIADRVGQFIEGGVLEDGARHHTPEELYNSRQGEKGEGEDGGEGGDRPAGGTGDDLLPGDQTTGHPVTQEQAHNQAVNIKQSVAKAAHTAKMRGDISSSVQRLIDEVLTVRTPWYEILERYMTDKSNSDYTWTRPNRRFVSSNTYLPSLHSTNALGHIVLGIDTSLSIDEKELATYTGHINQIIEKCNPAKVTVVYCDCAIKRVDEFTEYPINVDYLGGGGTDMTAIYDYINEQDLDPDVCVIMTDGYSPWADEMQDYPVCVLCTTDYDIPYVDNVIRVSI